MSPVISTGNVSVTENNNNNSNNMMEERYYESIIFSGPIVFTLIILFLFYFFYLRRHSVDWSSLRMRQSRIDSASASASVAAAAAADDLVNEVGLKKEFRELLPVIIYKESFSVNDTQCSVCLGDYQAEDRLQQIPGCCHTFHLYCIDHWLATHTTCPLCRLSLATSSKDPPDSLPDNPSDNDSRVDSVHSTIDGVLDSDNHSDNGSRVESVHSVDCVLNPDNPPDYGSRVDNAHSVNSVLPQSRLQVS